MTEKQNESLTAVYNAVCDAFGADLTPDEIREEVASALRDAVRVNTPLATPRA